MNEFTAALHDWLNPILLAIIGAGLVQAIRILTSSVNRILQQNAEEHARLAERQHDTECSVIAHEVRLGKVEHDVDGLKDRF